MAALSAMLLLAGLTCSFCCAYRLAGLAMRSCALRPAVLLERRHELLAHARERMGAFEPLARLSGSMRQRRRAARMEKALPEALRLLCISLESGASLVQALRYAADHCAEPLAGELKRTVWDLEAGHGFDEAIASLRERTGSPEFAFLAVAMEMQHQSGGSLSAILDSTSALLKQSSDLKEELRTKTSQGRLSSRIVALMPLVLVGLISLFSPGYLLSFFSSPLGACLLAMALVLEIAGVVLVRRSLSVDFGVDLEEA